VEVTSGSNTQTFMVRGQVLDCAAHDQVVAVALGDRAVLLNARTGRTETVYGAAMRIALGADWLAWTEGSDVRARRRGAADGLAPATMPSPVLYKTVRGGDFRVDIPTFFEESSTPHGGSWTWAWESATLEASAASMDSGATPATMCAEMVRNVAHVVSSQATKTGCFVTGTSGASILWKREQYRCGRRFRLAFEYDAALKADFDPIVSHVNASWQLQLDAGSCP
jgi:hypothetical protein